MKSLTRLLHLLVSPPTFDQIAAPLVFWLRLAALFAAIPAWIQIFGFLPAEQHMGDSVRILYLHVPAAWMSVAIFAWMAVFAFIGLVWQIRLCEILAMACAPVGTALTAITLITGSVWGRSTWGTYWDWDPRLTSELLLLFLYFGVLGLYRAIDHPRQAARAASLLILVSTALLPVIHYSVVWWDSLHQGQTIHLFGPSRMYGLSALWLMVFATHCWCASSILTRARADNLRYAAHTSWVCRRFGVDA